MQHDILNWQQRPAFKEWVIARLERGKAIESLIVLPELMRMGFEVIGGQQSCEIKSRDGSLVICTGHIDGLLEWQDHRVVMDCKSMHPILWQKLNSVEDLLCDKFGYRYPWQLLLYMYANELESGLFLVDDCLGHWKTISVHLWDYAERCEQALTRCEEVMRANAACEMLPFHDDPAYCRDCWCYQAGVCSPPMDFADQAVQIISNEELAEALERAEELEETGTQYKRLEEKIKKTMKAYEQDGQFLCGDFLLTRSTTLATAYNVPKEIKDQYKTTGQRVAVKWARVGG